MVSDTKSRVGSGSTLLCSSTHRRLRRRLHFFRRASLFLVSVPRSLFPMRSGCRVTLEVSLPLQVVHRETEGNSHRGRRKFQARAVAASTNVEDDGDFVTQLSQEDPAPIDPPTGHCPSHRLHKIDLLLLKTGSSLLVISKRFGPYGQISLEVAKLVFCERILLRRGLVLDVP
ncbi:hypothetical protein AALP_AA6G282900 [Arabis alpina]|uniref:Uncharacterized protein n=1 Tax=Arabis alpina TaxID=50452 RepID=A0A087GS89_ARAAL|nr:hypothetical protein AALP_AA6G282900 [Arabis alpina]